MQYKELLKEEESEYLDFKYKWHEHNLELIYDIICLANSDTSCDKYLVIGYNNKKNSYYDVKNDCNRKTLENIYNLLQESKLNRLPKIQLQSININKKTLDIITIKNTDDKPYFFTEDKEYNKPSNESSSKQERKRLFRAGVIYTRNGGTNTPINSTASDFQMEKMWKKRLGLTLPPIQRLEKYIQDTENWKYSDTDGITIAFYEPFPEFTIHISPIKSSTPCNKSYWLNTIGSSFECDIIIKHNLTVIKKIPAYYVDNNRYIIIAPNFFDIYSKKDTKEIILWHYDATSPPKYTAEELYNTDIFSHKKLYYHIKNSFDYMTMLLFNSSISFNYFFNCPKTNPLEKVFLFENDFNIEDECRKALKSLIL